MRCTVNNLRLQLTRGAGYSVAIISAHHSMNWNSSLTSFPKKLFSTSKSIWISRNNPVMKVKVNLSSLKFQTFRLDKTVSRIGRKQLRKFQLFHILKKQQMQFTHTVQVHILSAIYTLNIPNGNKNNMENSQSWKVLKEFLNNPISFKFQELHAASIS